MKLLTVIGARPQFIKAATVSRAIAERDDIVEVIVHTGQHYDTNMSDVFFDDLSIPQPDHHLGIGGGRHGEMTGQMIEALESVMLVENPDLVLVYGDTNSTLAGALAAVKLHIPIAHVEAGLRSFNRRMPEEINRILTDHASDLLFAPTQTAMVNLRNEGLGDGRARLVGDVMYDASLFYREKARAPDWAGVMRLDERDFILATVHRAENADNPVRLQNILWGLASAGLPVVLPLHPRTRDRIATMDIAIPIGVHVVDPVGYLEMVWLEAHCRLVATDSGGVQKEAYFFGKPCVTLREETEWVELVEVGWNTLTGANPEAIRAAVNAAHAPAAATALYGDGDAAGKVLAGILE